MSKVVTFGEIMLRLEPSWYYRFVQAESFQASYGGGEANVAVSLANFGVDAEFVTKLPEHLIGTAACNALRRYGVGTQYIIRGGDRIGIYFLEKGASQRASKVVYDRAGSAVATAKPEEFDWDSIFEGADWFHFTGITPALGGSLPEICLAACKAAKAHGLTVSCDLNYRKKLWSQQRAREVMTSLMPYVDVCIGNEEDAATVFGIRASGSDVTQGKIDRNGYIDVARQLTERFALKLAAITLRTSITASDNRWAAMLYSDGTAHFSKEYPVHIVDRVGGGDSFAAGLIYALRAGKSCADALEFATAASCLKHSIEGDANFVSVEEVEALAEGDGSGRVQR